MPVVPVPSGLSWEVIVGGTAFPEPAGVRRWNERNTHFPHCRDTVSGKLELNKEMGAVETAVRCVLSVVSTVFTLPSFGTSQIVRDRE